MQIYFTKKLRLYQPTERKLKTNKKRILLVGRNYFFYTHEIISQIENSSNFNVTFYPIEPESFFYKLANKFNFFSKNVLVRYHKNIIKKEKNVQYDIIFFLQVHQIGNLISDYKAAFNNSYFLLYYWDSLATHNYSDSIKYFNKVYTFDKLDADQHSALSYLPLFYTESFQNMRDYKSSTLQISFVGTIVNLNRYEELLKFRNWAKENNLIFKDYVVISIFNYIKCLFKGKVLHKVHFSALSKINLEPFYRESHVILDLPNNIQSGYTMRTFETIGSYKKLITTNFHIVNEPFFSSKNIFISDSKSVFPKNDFLNVDFDKSDCNLISEYSLKSWVNNLLSQVDANT